MFQSFSWLFDLVPTSILSITHLCTWAWCSMVPGVLCITHQGRTVQSWGHCSLAEAGALVLGSLLSTAREYREHPVD